MKRCTKCGLSVDEGAEFGKNKTGKNGLRSKCKECIRKRKEKYYYSEKGIKVRKQYEQSEKCKEGQKKYIQSEKCKETRKRYFQSEEIKEKLKRYHKKYRQSENGKAIIKRHRQSEKSRKTYKAYCQLESAKEVNRKYHQTEQYKEYQKKYRQSKRGKEVARERYIKNKASHCLSSVLRLSLKGKKAGHHWEDLVGWTLQQFKNRFNQLFKPGMTWENHGAAWEIDHIVPLSVHNITSIDCTDFKRAWALSNLQPLFVKENQSKSNRLETHFQPTLF